MEFQDGVNREKYFTTPLAMSISLGGVNLVFDA